MRIDATAVGTILTLLGNLLPSGKKKERMQKLSEVAVSIGMVRYSWPRVKGKLERACASDPELATFFGQVETMIGAFEKQP